MASRFAPAIRRTWLQQELYGWRHAPSLENCKSPFLYAKLLLSATGAAPPQREYVLGMFYTLHGSDRGAPDGELIQYVHHFDPQPCDPGCGELAAVSVGGCPPQDDAPDIQQLIAMSDEPLRQTDGVKLRVLLYDALSASRATRTVEEEPSAPTQPRPLSANEGRVVRQLGLSTVTADRIARLCDREAALVSRRRRLIHANRG